jgi:protein-S-isoprenylcysteine O-methyltransferase Ste14
MQRGAAAEARVEEATARHSVASILCNIVLAGFFSLFLIAQITNPDRWDWARSFPIVAQVSVMVMMFLTRRPSAATTTSPIEWIVAVAGTLCPMLMRTTPVPGELAWIGQPLQVLGLVLSTAALLSIGRSIAVVPANRGIKTGGAFRMVRHPVYAAYIFTFAGFVMSSPTARNAVVGIASLLLLGLRAVFEERFLMRDPRYAAYAEQVRWRLFPGVF